MKDAKRHHWHRFLATLTDANLFTAAKYCDGPPPSRILPPLQQADGSLTDDPAAKAELLFKATGGPTIACDRSDITPPPPPSGTPTVFTLEEVESRLKRLKLGKAPGSDGITALVLKHSGDCLTSCLTTLLNSCLHTGFFPSQWKTANTIILRKPGKPNYNNPSAYQPIALLSTLSNTLEGAIADRLQAFAEHHSLLPEGHYGGRAKRSTTDALLNLTVWTKNQWAKGNTVGALFVDVKAAFPTVDPLRMTHTLRELGYCPFLIKLISNFLSHRKTTFQLGDYRSDPKQLTIGLPQGSPLSVILYILYNSPLLRQVEGYDNAKSMGFIADVAVLTAHKSVESVTASLQSLADRELAWGKKHGAAFDRQKSQWMLLTHKKPPPTPPSLSLGDVELVPQPLVKWLGVWMDPKLTFTHHVKAQAARGLGTASRLASLARTGWVIPLGLCKRLTTSLVHTRTDYACVVWHKYRGSTTSSAALQKVDNVAHRFSLGAFKTHPTALLLHDTNSLCARDRLDNKSDAALACLLTLPLSNPAGKIAQRALSHNHSKHLSTIHQAFKHPDSTWSRLPHGVEEPNPDLANLPPHPRITASIAANRQDFLDFLTDNLADSPNNTQVIYCDGSSQEKGTGAAALDDHDNNLKLRMGDQLFYTAYDGELLGLLLALGVARRAPMPTAHFWILSDSQTDIRDITNPTSVKTGQHIRHLIKK